MSAALHDAFMRAGLTEILAYTAPDNPRSQAVMDRLRMTRDPSRDFTLTRGDTVPWHGMVWVAVPERRA
jgi:RimJ/RimL family protein N-acetyltransferase